MEDDQVRLDFERPKRVGFDEAILCPRKSRAQIETILDKVKAAEKSCLLTRLDETVYATISDHHRAAIDYDEISRTGYFNWTQRTLDVPSVAVVAAGSSDMPVAAEALRTLAYYGITTESFIDVGVAGLWRLMEHIDHIRTFPVIITVAGMDGALPSVLGGLVPGLVVAVPTSTGYGAARGGETALNAALASCASGLCVVNIDNGYGAALAAYRIVNAPHLATGRATACEEGVQHDRPA